MKKYFKYILILLLAAVACTKSLSKGQSKKDDELWRVEIVGSIPKSAGSSKELKSIHIVDGWIVLPGVSNYTYKSISKSELVPDQEYLISAEIIADSTFLRTNELEIAIVYDGDKTKESIYRVLSHSPDTCTIYKVSFPYIASGTETKIGIYINMLNQNSQIGISTPKFRNFRLEKVVNKYDGLIHNGDFEMFGLCPMGDFSGDDFLLGWNMALLSSEKIPFRSRDKWVIVTVNEKVILLGTPDLICSCSKLKIWRYVQPSSGHCYIKMGTYHKGRSKKNEMHGEFVQTKLSETLKKNVQYDIEVDFMKDPSTKFANNNLGLLLSAEPFSLDSTNLGGVYPKSEYLFSKEPIVEWNKWQTFKLTYTARGDEKFLTIGPFHSNSVEPKLVRLKEPSNDDYINSLENGYYLIDNVRIKEIR